MFQLGPNNLVSYLDMTCKNDPEGGPPIWDPPYDNVIIPFPPCVPVGKYKQTPVIQVQGVQYFPLAILPVRVLRLVSIVQIVQYPKWQSHLHCWHH